MANFPKPKKRTETRLPKLEDNRDALGIRYDGAFLTGRESLEGSFDRDLRLKSRAEPVVPEELRPAEKRRFEFPARFPPHTEDE